MWVELLYAGSIVGTALLGTAPAVARGVGRRRIQRFPERTQFGWRATLPDWILTTDRGVFEGLGQLRPVPLGTLVVKSALYRRRYAFLYIPSGGYAVVDLKAIGLFFLTEFDDRSVLVSGAHRDLNRGALTQVGAGSPDQGGGAKALWTAHHARFDGRKPSPQGGTEDHVQRAMRRYLVLLYGPACPPLPAYEPTTRLHAQSMLRKRSSSALGRDQKRPTWLRADGDVVTVRREKSQPWSETVEVAFVGEEAAALLLGERWVVLSDAPTAELLGFIAPLWEASEGRARAPVPLPGGAIRIGEDGVRHADHFFAWRDVQTLRFEGTNGIVFGFELREEHGRRFQAPLPAPIAFANGLSIHMRRLHHAARPRREPTEALTRGDRTAEAWLKQLLQAGRGGYRDALPAGDLQEVRSSPAYPPASRLAAAVLLGVAASEGNAQQCALIAHQCANTALRDGLRLVSEGALDQVAPHLEALSA